MECKEEEMSELPLWSPSELKSLGWLDDEIEIFSDPGNTPERAIFRAVIMQALLDSVITLPRYDFFKKDALRWFDIDNKDFIKVCELAELEAEWVLNKCKKSIEEGCVHKYKIKKH